MVATKHNLSLIRGGRDEVEQELVKLGMSVFPIPTDEYIRLRSIAVRNGQQG